MVEMTRRPILIGTAAIFALILTAGLAYGSGRMQSTHPRHNQSVQMVGTHMNPGYGWNHQGQGWRQGPTAENHHAWMGNHNRQGGSWAGMMSGHRNGTHDGYRYDHHYGAPSGTGTYDHHNGSSGNDRHACW
jgi:hypothetical protein